MGILWVWYGYHMVQGRSDIDAGPMRSRLWFAHLAHNTLSSLVCAYTVARGRDAEFGIKGIYLRSKRISNFCRYPLDFEEKCKNMQNYLRISFFLCNFAPQNVWHQTKQLKYNGRKQRIDSKRSHYSCEDWRGNEDLLHRLLDVCDCEPCAAWRAWRFQACSSPCAIRYERVG